MLFRSQTRGDPEMKAEEFRQVIDIDLNAPFIVSKAVIPGDRKSVV